MEGLERHLPHDFEPHSIGQIALRHWIDETIAETDRGAFEWMEKLKDMDI